MSSDALEGYKLFTFVLFSLSEIVFYSIYISYFFATCYLFAPFSLPCF